MIFDIVMKVFVEGCNVEFCNFGVFEVQKCKLCIGCNLNKLEVEVVILECVVVKFRLGKIFK